MKVRSMAGLELYITRTGKCWASQGGKAVCLEEDVGEELDKQVPPGLGDDTADQFMRVLAARYRT